MKLKNPERSSSRHSWTFVTVLIQHEKIFVLMDVYWNERRIIQSTLWGGEQNKPEETGPWNTADGTCWGFGGGGGGGLWMMQVSCFFFSWYEKAGQSIRPLFKPRSESLTVFARKVSLDCPPFCLWHHHRHQPIVVVPEYGPVVVLDQQFTIKGGIRQFSSTRPALTSDLTAQYLVSPPTGNGNETRWTPYRLTQRSWSHGTHFWTSLKLRVLQGKL